MTRSEAEEMAARWLALPSDRLRPLLATYIHEATNAEVGARLLGFAVGASVASVVWFAVTWVVG